MIKQGLATGPYSVNYSYVSRKYDILDANGICLGQCYSHHHAVLFAASWELLAACEMGIEGLFTGPELLRFVATFEGEIAIADALRAKADVEQAALRRARGEE